MNSDVPLSEPAAARIADWLREHLVGIFGTASLQYSPEPTFEQLGLDSAAAASMAGDLSDWLECELDVTAVYEYPTITQLSEYLAARDDVRQKAQRVGPTAVSHG